MKLKDYTSRATDSIKQLGVGLIRSQLELIVKKKYLMEKKKKRPYTSRVTDIIKKIGIWPDWDSRIPQLKKVGTQKKKKVKSA